MRQPASQLQLSGRRKKYSFFSFSFSSQSDFDSNHARAIIARSQLVSLTSLLRLSILQIYPTRKEGIRFSSVSGLREREREKASFFNSVFEYRHFRSLFSSIKSSEHISSFSCLHIRTRTHARTHAHTLTHYFSLFFK